MGIDLYIISIGLYQSGCRPTPLLLSSKGQSVVNQKDLHYRKRYLYVNCLINARPTHSRPVPVRRQIYSPEQFALPPFGRGSATLLLHWWPQICHAYSDISPDYSGWSKQRARQL